MLFVVVEYSFQTLVACCEDQMPLRYCELRSICLKAHEHGSYVWTLPCQNPHVESYVRGSCGLAEIARNHGHFGSSFCGLLSHLPVGTQIWGNEPHLGSDLRRDTARNQTTSPGPLNYHISSRRFQVCCVEPCRLCCGLLSFSSG